MNTLTLERETIETQTESKYNPRNTKRYNILEVNRRYMEQFQLAKYPDLTDPKQKSCWNQYRCSISNYLESITKDAAMSKRDDVENFLQSKNAKNKQAHLKTFFTFLITQNTNNSTTKMNRDFLIKVIEM